MKKITAGLLSNASLSAVCLVVVMLTGCSKAKLTDVEPPTTQNVQQAEQDHMPVPAAPAKAPVVVAQPNGEPDLAELNRAMIRWLMANRRKPANFEDFAATAGVTIPPPPAGKKYIVASDMHIKLVNR